MVATLADDGINTVCNWNEAPGADVTQAILDITANPGFKSGADADIVSAIKDPFAFLPFFLVRRFPPRARYWRRSGARCGLAWIHR